MLGTGTTRPHPDAPDQADDLIGYLRRGPRQLPPGIPEASPPRRAGKPIIPALACVAALAGLLVGCQITKQPPAHSASPSASASRPSPGGTGALPSPHSSSASPSPHPSPHASSPHPSPAPAPSGSEFALPATSGQLSIEVSSRVFAARTLHIRVDVSTPQANTLRQTLDGPISVAPDGTLTGNATGTADRNNGVHVSAPLIFLPRQFLYIAPPAHLMPAGKTWALITPADANGRASWAARESAYVLYASATSWNLLRYATDTARPHWSGSGASARAHMSGTAVLATVLPHATPGARDAVITFAGPGTTDITWNVLLDSRLLPVSCVITARSPSLGPITATVTYSGWGTPVRAAAPPAPDVATYSELPPYLREVTQ
jgi:hypothetical protein